ncbi:MAG TPA: flagellar motor switch protein FliN [Castellaniella sp.]|uniref:flagellar motor switch protein FliN n=1 Tax=Castellaniella sp. TaxID=1955812 RepID=UPI002F1A4CBD
MSDTQEPTDSANPTGQTPATPPNDDWAAALAEQASAQKPVTQASGLSTEDDWAAALAEQTAATTPTAPSTQATQATAQVFQPLEGHNGTSDSDIDMIMDIPVQLSVELGRTRLTIKNILQLGQGSVVELDGMAGEPMDIYVNGYLIAQGEVVVVDEKYGIRVTDIITPSDRIARLNSRR